MGQESPTESEASGASSAQRFLPNHPAPPSGLPTSVSELIERAQSGGGMIIQGEDGGLEAHQALGPISGANY